MRQTSVIIDVDKWNTLKARGYKLQDIVDTAFNNLLDINLTDNLELNKEKDNLKDKKKSLLLDLEEVEKEYNSKITVIKNEIKDIDFKIKAIEDTITENEKRAAEDKILAEEKLAEKREHNILFNSILRRFNNYAATDPNCSLMEFLQDDSESAEYCNKYGLSLSELSKKIERKIIGLD